MEHVMTETTLLNNVFPTFIKNVEIVEPAGKAVRRICQQNANTVNNTKKINCDLKVDTMPTLLTSNAVRQVYQQNKFGEIKELEKQAQKDLQVLYDNIKKNKENAWVKVRAEVYGKTQEFYMTWSNNACMWIRQKDGQNVKTGDEQKYMADVEVGTYSKSTSIMGIHTYNLSITVMLVESVICYLIVKAISGIIAEGIGFVVAHFAPYIIDAAIELGFESFSCTVLAGALSSVAACLVFVVLFIGLSFLWDWLNRKYTIRLQIFNWDKDNDWSVGKDYTGNAKIAGGDSQQNITIHKLDDPDIPSFITPVEPLESICHYVVIVWENDNTFMEGCSMALQLKKGNSNEGFMWAFDCPRFSDNKNKGSNGIMDPKAYFNQGNWSNSPKNFSITSTSSQIPVTFALDALHGADDNLYNINIHINHKE